MERIPLSRTLRLMDRRPGKTPLGDPPRHASPPSRLKWHLLVGGCGRLTAKHKLLSAELFAARLRFTPSTVCKKCARMTPLIRSKDKVAGKTIAAMITAWINAQWKRDKDRRNKAP